MELLQVTPLVLLRLQRVAGLSDMHFAKQSGKQKVSMHVLQQALSATDQLGAVVVEI